MMCKDCFHYEVCLMYVSLVNSENKASEQGAENCKCFKIVTHSPKIIYCKDCKYYKNDTDYCRKRNKGYCEFDDTVKSKNHYCGYAERAK